MNQTNKTLLSEEWNKPKAKRNNSLIKELQGKIKEESKKKVVPELERKDVVELERKTKKEENARHNNLKTKASDRKKKRNKRIGEKTKTKTTSYKKRKLSVKNGRVVLKNI